LRASKGRKFHASDESLRARRGEQMVTWVLTEEPTFEVARAIEIVEARLGSTEEVMWLCPDAVATEPAGE
jgi:hypothetical protein